MKYGIFALIVLAVAGLVYAMASSKQEKPAPAPAAATPGCVHQADLEKTVDAAIAAVNAGDKEAALKALNKIKEHLTSCQKRMAETKGACAAGKESAACPMGGCSMKKATTQSAGIVNTKCPIMGNPIDPTKVPEVLTREYKGQKVGFCCGGCPAAWDQMSDAEKQAKLDAAK